MPQDHWWYGTGYRITAAVNRTNTVTVDSPTTGPALPLSANQTISILVAGALQAYYIRLISFSMYAMMAKWLYWLCSVIM